MLAEKLSSLSARRLALDSRIKDIASLIPEDQELHDLKETLAAAESKRNAVEEKLKGSYAEGGIAVLKTVLDLAEQFKGGFPRDITERLGRKEGLSEKQIDELVKDLGTALADSESAQREYVDASKNLANASMKAIERMNLVQLRGLLAPLREQLDEIDMQIKDLQSQIAISYAVNYKEVKAKDKDKNDGGDEGGDKKTETKYQLDSVKPGAVPDGYTQVYIDADASSMVKSTSQSASSSVSTSGWSFWFCGYRSTSSQSASSFASMTESKKSHIEIGMNVAKVGIEREWFNPGVFALTKDMFNVTTLRISPNPNLPYTSMSDDRLHEMSQSKYVFPCYPTAMVIARDVSIRFTMENNVSSEFADSVERHAASGGGFLFFSGSSASSSRSSSSGVHSSIKGNTVTLKFSTPQVIGYYMEATPADKSTYLDDVSSSASAGYVTISKFVEDYKKILEKMREKKEGKKEERQA